ncbi:MAG: hypothetical protein WC052_05030 [Patescibacteria group bacterium]|jgi:hypothetical protein
MRLLPTAALATFFRDPWVHYPYGFAMFVLCGVAISFVAFLPAGDAVPLHYNVYFGIDYLGDMATALRLPLVGGIFVIMNATVAWLVWQHKQSLARFLALGTVAVTIIIALSASLTLSINLAT